MPGKEEQKTVQKKIQHLFTPRCVFSQTIKVIAVPDDSENQYPILRDSNIVSYNNRPETQHLSTEEYTREKKERSSSSIVKDH